MSHAQEAIRLRALGFHPIVEKPNEKTPLEPAWQKLVNRSDAILRVIFDAHPDGGIGTITHGFIVVDLDVREDKNGIEALRALPPLPPTLTSCTPSGGRHLFFRIPAGVEIHNSVSRVGPGIDIRGTGGQVVLPPTVVNGKAYAWARGAEDRMHFTGAMAELPASWFKLLLDLEGQAKASASAPDSHTPAGPSSLHTLHQPQALAIEAARRARYMATLQEPSIQGAGGNAVMMKAAFHAKEMSRGTAEALPALVEWSARLANPPWSEHELLRALQNSEAVWGAGLDREKESSGAVAIAGNASASSDVAWVEKMQAYVARDRRTGVWDIKNPLSEKGAQMALVARGLSSSDAKAALRECRVVLAHRVECDPSRPPTFEQDGQLVLNNYIPPTMKPAQGAFDVLAEVLSFLTCGDEAARRWLVNWLAFAAQNPARPMRTVPVLFGAQRTGKSLISRAVTTILGEQNCATIRNDDIKGKFTSHFVDKLFVTVSEIEAGEVTHATSTLKYLTGEPQLVHEAKGSAAFYTPNRIKMMCNSNQTLPVVIEGDGDSRWVLFKQLEKPPADYSARMDALFDKSTNDWSEQGKRELAAFAYFLLNWQVDAQLARTIYVNAARTSAVEASRSSVEQFVEAVKGSSLDAVWLANVPDYDRTSTQYEGIDFPGHEHVTGAGAVYATYRAFCKTSGLLALGNSKFPGELERHAPDWKRHKVTASVHATRPWAYVGIQRERRLRLQYLPPEMKQGSLFVGADAEKRLSTPATRAIKDSLTPDAMNSQAQALAAVQGVFGLEEIEEVES